MRRKLTTKRAALVAILAFAFWATPIATLEVAAEAPAPSAIIEIAGRTYAGQAGLLLAQSYLTPEGNCAAIDYVIRLNAPASIGYGGVSVGMDEQCGLYVRDIVFTRETRLPEGTVGQQRPAATRLVWGAAAQAVTYQEMWGRHIMHEQFGIPTTLAHQQYRYTINGTSVSNPVATTEYCWQNGVGWTILSCTAAQEQGGPVSVQRWTKGDFTNQGGTLQHHLGTHPLGNWSGWTTYCDSIGASMPPGWFALCQSSWLY